MEGPIALALKSTFLTDWRDTGHPIDITDTSVKRPDSAGDIDIALIDGSAQIGFNDTQRVFEGLVTAAQQRILIQTPYFNPTPAILNLLKDAVTRGVEVDLLIPGPHIDKRVSLVMAEEMYLPLVDCGVRVWRYQPTMMHTKALLVDGIVSMVGSLNVNRRSIKKDEEAGVAIMSQRVTGELESHFQRDVSQSVGGAEGRRQTADASARLEGPETHPTRTLTVGSGPGPRYEAASCPCLPLLAVGCSPGTDTSLIKPYSLVATALRLAFTRQTGDSQFGVKSLR
jgi:cardiolipin synthase